MDDDGEVDSQSEVVVGSLSWWMMKSLWQEDTLPEQKLRLSLPDTVLLQDGHLLHWFFTSAKSGNILKRATKRLEWDEFLKFLVRCASSTTSKGKHTKGHAPHATSGDIVATARRLREGRTYPVMLTARDLISLREKHNAHLLDEIVAIQPFVAKDPFTGCGVFETEFERKGQNNHTTQAVVATYELLRWPENDVKWFGDVDELSAANSSQRDGHSFAPQRARDGSAKRVYGVIHRMLAATTKRIIEHVERAVG
ncbi:unnamed protein product [Ectocarpus sp. 12 AP-2014]